VARDGKHTAWPDPSIKREDHLPEFDLEREVYKNQNMKGKTKTRRAHEKKTSHTGFQSGAGMENERERRGERWSEKQGSRGGGSDTGQHG